MRKGSVQCEAVEVEGRLAVDLAAVLLHTEAGTCWSVHWENSILVVTTASMWGQQLLWSSCRGGKCVLLCRGGENLNSVEAQAHAGTGVITHSIPSDLPPPKEESERCSSVCL